MASSSGSETTGESVEDVVSTWAVLADNVLFTGQHSEAQSMKGVFDS